MYSIERYGVGEPYTPPSGGGKKVTAEDIEARRKLLKDYGLDDTFLSDLNDKAGAVIDARDQFHDALKSSIGDSLFGASGGVSAAGLGGLGSSAAGVGGLGASTAGLGAASSGVGAAAGSSMGAMAAAM